MPLADTLRDGVSRLRLKLWQKLALISVPALVPVAFLLYLNYSSSMATIGVARLEKKGLEAFRGVRRLLEHVEQHRTASAAALAGDESFRPVAAEKQRLVDADVIEMESLTQKLGEEMHTTAAWAKLRSDWTAIKDKTAAGVAPAESDALHDKFVGDLLLVGQDIGEYSTLTLDPVTDTYWLQALLLERVPAAAEAQALARDRTAAAAGRMQNGTEELVKIEVAAAGVKAGRESVGRAVDALFRFNPALRARLETPAAQFADASKGLEEFVAAAVVKGKTGPIGATPREVFDRATAATDTGFALYDAMEPELATLLDGRIAQTRREMLIAFGIAFAALALVATVALYVSRLLTRQVAAITNTFAEIGMGDFNARADKLTDDELGEAAVSLNAMLDNTLGLIQSQDEKEQIQNSIMKLLDEVSGVADGDLTKEAEVTADVTGAIADSFNYMLAQLREIIGAVKDATVNVSTTAGRIRTTAEHLAEGSEYQSAQIRDTSAAVEEMAESIRRVSDNAVRSAQVAEAAKLTAQEGAAAVSDTINGMGRIRDQVQETAKRIKRLGESTQQIGEIVQLIDDIAERTSLLALNASIQAAMAGEAGRGFAVVAQEVERLAERSTAATKKIGGLVKTIQTETAEAVAAMEEGTREVVEGSKLANQAGQALARIEEVSTQLDELSRSISSAATEQAKSSEGVAASMTRISEGTERTAAGTKDAALSVNELAEMADALRGSVSRFRLPAEAGVSPTEALNGYANGHLNGSANGKGHHVLA